MTLTDFLLARIAEDEAVARAASPGPWRAEDEEVLAVDGITVCDSFALSGPQTRATAAHIALHDPARVLAECEAKRRIVAAFEDERVRRDIYNRDYGSGEYDFNENDLRARLASNAECRGLEVAMLALALPYADHPDFQEGWKP